MSAAAFDVVLPDRTRVPVRGQVTIGRELGSTIHLDDPSVSRRHARLADVDGAVVVEDAGSRFGTWVDGARVVRPARLRDGAVVRVGDQELVLERRREANESLLTRIVPAGASLLDLDEVAGAGPRLRSGYAVKRLAASEGARRWVLRDLRADRYVRLAGEGELLELIDGRRTVAELLEASRARLGDEGPAKVVALLSELAERGLLAGPEDGGADAATAAAAPPRARATREWAWPGAGGWFAALDARTRSALFSPGALGAIALVALSGLVVFAALVAGRYGTPFVVARHVGIGGAVFVLGRLAVAGVHETAHGLTMAHFGRRVGRAGIKVVLIFPFAFVDTSEAWLLPRARRIAVSAAGPVSDATLGGLFSWACLVQGPGILRDICFQLAFGAYVGALVNLNPFVERDGYHMLADALDQPGLRRRARADLQRRLRSGGEAPASPVLRRYALAGLGWSVVATALAVVLSLRYAPALRAVVPAPVAWAMLAMVWVAAAVPALSTLGGPLVARARGRDA